MATFQQDYKPVVLGTRKAGSSSGDTQGSKDGAAEPKKPQSIGLNGKLDSQIAAKLDSADAKAPETVGIDIGKVREWIRCLLRHTVKLSCMPVRRPLQRLAMRKAGRPQISRLPSISTYAPVRTLADRRLD